MKRIAMLLLLLFPGTAFTQTVNVEVWRSKRVELRACSEHSAKILTRTGKPTAAEVQAFKESAYDLIRFTETMPVLLKTCDSWPDAAAAMTAICATREEPLTDIRPVTDDEGAPVRVLARCGSYKAEIVCP